ncbi:MAG: hypothetical protein HOQ22_04715 [Nocardioidaceae bacterium]|nr:hypothetical protein [Nocardioidaceae bacterium]NUS50329.1 hypothetical protein [Nocardioidaceae bacterium]
MLDAWALRFVGRVSYAFYLWHVPLFRLSGTTYGRASTLPWIVLSFALAVASTLLEEPLRRRWRHRSGRAGSAGQPGPGRLDVHPVQP